MTTVPAKSKLVSGVSVTHYKRSASALKGKPAPPRVVLAHGAGAGQNHPFIVACARALAARGIDVTTFDFPYMAKGKKSPDTPAVLEACVREVLRQSAPGPVVLGGKSMGGRVASQVVAAGGSETAGVCALFFLGYPLHPPGKPTQLRVDHWPNIQVPCLFVQGTRDAFGSPKELARHVAKLRGKHEVVPVENGDHSFGVPKRAGVPQEDVDAKAHDAVARFVIAQGGRSRRV